MPTMERNHALPALAVLSVALVVMSPYFGAVTRILQVRYPFQYGSLLLGVLLAGALVVMVPVSLALVRRPIGTLPALIGIPLLVFANSRIIGNPVFEINLVERLHFFEYGALSILAFYAFRRLLPDLSVYPFSVLYATWAGFADETFQYFVLSRWGDIRDILFDGSAATAGVLFVAFVIAPGGIERRFPPRGEAAVLAGLAFVLACVGGFFYEVHGGYTIRDPEIGTFRSYYPAAKLLSFSKEKNNRKWLEESRTVFRGDRLWGIKDYFRVEGIKHYWEYMNLRKTGEVHKAAAERAILMKYYTPVANPELGLQFPVLNRESDGDRGSGSPLPVSRHHDVILVEKSLWTLLWIGAVTVLPMAWLWFGWRRRAGTGSVRKPGQVRNRGGCAAGSGDSLHRFDRESFEGRRR
jgi:hypothetical protein